MALPDVPDTYRVIVRQLFFAQEILNVFHYRDVAITGFLPVNIASGFWNAVKAAWRAWLPNSASLIFDRVDVEALFDDHAFGSYSIPSAERQGTRAAGGSNLSSPNLAGAIKLEVGTRVTRPGSKRIVGLLDADHDYVTITAGPLALLQALADVLDQDVTPTGGGAAVSPVIVGYPSSITSLGLRVQDVTNGVASQFLSHQVSRDPRP